MGMKESSKNIFLSISDVDIKHVQIFVYFNRGLMHLDVGNISNFYNSLHK